MYALELNILHKTGIPLHDTKTQPLMYNILYLLAVHANKLQSVYQQLALISLCAV